MSTRSSTARDTSTVTDHSATQDRPLRQGRTTQSDQPVGHAHSGVQRVQPAPSVPVPSSVDRVDLTTAPSEWPERMDDPSDAHLLRLCVDLQLDALLLALGAVAVSRPGPEPEGLRATTVEPEEPGRGPVAVEWLRWVREDVELVTQLAADALEGGAALPPTMGTDAEHGDQARTAACLEARYAGMSTLLTQLLTRRDLYAGSGGWRPHAREALRRCTARLAELQRVRQASSPSPQRMAHSSAVPGEWLG